MIQINTRPPVKLNNQFFQKVKLLISVLTRYIINSEHLPGSMISMMVQDMRTIDPEIKNNIDNASDNRATEGGIRPLSLLRIIPSITG